MNLARLARLVAITTAVAAIADGQLEFDGENLPTKLNYQKYISQFISKTESTAPINIEPLILGGSIVPSGTKTYTTGVRPTANGTDFCGGSLITPTHVLTAAHCMAGDVQYVSVGAIGVDVPDTLASTVEFPLREIGCPVSPPGRCSIDHPFTKKVVDAIVDMNSTEYRVDLLTR